MQKNGFRYEIIGSGSVARLVRVSFSTSQAWGPLSSQSAYKKQSTEAYISGMTDQCFPLSPPHSLKPVNNILKEDKILYFYSLRNTFTWKPFLLNSRTLGLLSTAGVQVPDGWQADLQREGRDNSQPRPTASGQLPGAPTRSETMLSGATASSQGGLRAAARSKEPYTYTEGAGQEGTASAPDCEASECSTCVVKAVVTTLL